MTISAIFPSLGLSGAAGSASAGQATPSVNFLDMISGALHSVSAAQNAASTAESGFVSGAAGATLPKALVASDQAEVDWNATVAVRNEVVSAYQSIMNMQF